MTDEKSIRIAQKTLAYLSDLVETENMEYDEAIAYALTILQFFKLVDGKQNEYLAGHSTGSDILDDIFERSIEDAFDKTFDVSEDKKRSRLS